MRRCGHHRESESVTGTVPTGMVPTGTMPTGMVPNVSA